MTLVILSEAKDLLFAAQKGCAICVRDSASSDMRRFFVYILASRSRRLYVGITNDLFRRVLAHRNGESAFTARYRINRLVYVESCTDVRAAITREKQIKGWLRIKKLELIDSFNPKWDDLAATWLSEKAATTDPSLRSG